MPKHSTILRDAALRRLGRLNRWLIAGSVALMAVLTEVAASAFPGKTLKTSASGTHGHSPTSVHKAQTQPVKPPVRAPTATPEDQTRAESPSGESAPAQESAPTQESAPAQESSPSRESAPAQESAPPPSEPAPTHESAPTPAPAPAEQAPPVVSGGS